MTDTPPLGLRHGTVKVVPSDPRWPRTYARLAAGLTAALGGLARAVEHVGSTSVPGLPAKPIIDIAVLLVPGADADRLAKALAPLGYDFVGDTGDRGGLLFVLESRPGHVLAHLHAIADGDEQWRRYLELRDLLRTDPAARAGYAELKHGLAARYGQDRAGYTDAKTDFIGGLLDRAPRHGSAAEAEG